MVNDAFNINDSFTASVQHQATDHIPAAATLKKPPKWLRRPCGASFGVRALCSGGGIAEYQTCEYCICNIIDWINVILRLLLF